MIARWIREDTGEAHVLEDDGRLVRYNGDRPSRRRSRTTLKRTVSTFSRRFMETRTRDELVEIVQSTLGASHKRKETS